MTDWLNQALFKVKSQILPSRGVQDPRGNLVASSAVFYIQRFRNSFLTKTFLLIISFKLTIILRALGDN